MRVAPFSAGASRLYYFFRLDYPALTDGAIYSRRFAPLFPGSGPDSNSALDGEVQWAISFHFRLI
jgi:hypothetical protein